MEHGYIIPHPPGRDDPVAGYSLDGIIVIQYARQNSQQPIFGEAVMSGKRAGST
jgi:hypothetical protein